MATLRGTGIQASSASSYSVNFPSGTVAGDTAILMVGHGWGANTPSGWTNQNSLTGTNWNGAVFSKVLTSGDITTGHVTVTFAGSFDGTLAIVTIVGAAYYVRSVDASRNGSGSTSVSLSTANPAIGGSDLALYFGSNRAASTDTVSRGTMQRQANDGSAASGCLYTEAIPSGGILSSNFLYSSAGIGNYQAIVLISPTPVPVAANNYPPVTNADKGGNHQPVKSPAALTFTPSHFNPVPVASALKSGVSGTAYSETLTAQGGTSPYSFTVISGALPTGTTLNSSSGVISGTPSSTGSFFFTIQVTDAGGFTGSQAFSIAIAAPPPPSGGSFVFMG